jgi:hypothetical protein
MQVVLGIVSIITFIAHEHWLLIWLVTGVAGLVILGAPQAFDIARILRKGAKAKVVS